MPKVAAKRQKSEPSPLPPAAESHLSLVNPTTGLANDYLNVFNEILLLIEFLPSMPEMTDEALAWRPRSYCDYFRESAIPGAHDALRAYDEVDPDVRREFESILSRLTEIASRAQAEVERQSGGPNYPDSVARACEETAEAMRAGLSYVSRLINEGRAAGAGRSRLSKKPHADGY